MALLTSYLAKGTELNDGTNYNVPRQGTSFDDRNPSTSEYAYRKGDVPVLTGVSIKEGVLTLPININAKTASEWKTKLQTLKTIFNTQDPTPFQFQRKRPSDSVYSYIMVTVREFVVNETERTATVTLETADRSWLEPAWNQQQITLFETAARTEDLVINYPGATPYEPIVTVKLLTEGNDGPRPMYFHYVTVYTQGQAHVVGEPLLLVDNWNTTTMVADGEMRADGLDIEVEFTNGWDVPRLVTGASNARKIWIQPTTWPWRFDVTLAPGPTWNTMADPADPMLTSSAMEAYVSISPAAAPDANGFTTEFPASGTFMVDGEIISYSGVTWLNSTMTQAKLTLTARGVAGGTAAANHYEFRRVLFPTTLVVRYGYPPGYAGPLTAFNLNGWRLIDYLLSTNSQWVQTAQYTPWSGMTPWYRMGWGAWDKIETASYRRYYGEAIEGRSVYGRTAVNRVAKMVLVGQNTGNWNTLTLYTQWGRLSCIADVGDRARGRVFSYVRFYPKLLAQAGKTIKASARIIQSGFGSYGISPDGRSWIPREVSQVVWQQSHTGALQTQYDSNWLWTGMWYQPFQGVSIELDHIPAGQTTEINNLLLEKVEWLLDQEYGGSPVATAIGGQQGGSTVYMTMQNVTDTQTSLAFYISTLMGVNDTNTVDCANRTVSGDGATPLLLREVRYSNPTWLRLLPGNNTIRFTGLTNTGQLLVTVKWQVKN